VVIVTHSDMESDQQASIKVGADSFLHKASDLDHFKKDIEHILNRWLGANMPHLKSIRLHASIGILFPCQLDGSTDL
jgi:DNA-binding NarL/FixJ family response regulator